MAKIDLNSDMGESFGQWKMGSDLELLDYVTSANIACGFHAGDPQVMAQTVKWAAAKKVAVGAHPSYPDLQGFGRRKIEMTPAEIESSALYQIGALAAFAKANKIELVHVKAHGSLYNVAALEPEVARAIAKAVAAFSRDLVLVGLATSPTLLQAGEELGLAVAGEAFIDRAYNPDGTLMSRKLPGSLITDPTVAVKQALGLAQRGEVTASDGTVLKLKADTLCIHGDGPNALQLAQAVRAAFVEAGVETCPLRG